LAVELVVWVARLVILAGLVQFIRRVAASWRDTEGAGSGRRGKDPRRQGAAEE